MTPRTIITALVLLVVVALGVDAVIQHVSSPTVDQAVAHQITIQKETVLVVKKIDVVHARTEYRTLRDTTLLHLTDTLRVKEVLARADTLLVKDSLALQAADEVITSTKNELALALKPRAVPRLRVTVAGLYDPLHATTSAAADVGFRVIGGWQLVARAEQPLAVGTSPRVAVGLAKTF